MTGILKEIVAHKRTEVEEAKRRTAPGEMELLAHKSPHPRDFTSALDGDGCALIAEIKTASPSRGMLREDADPESIARIYEKNGAACISVLTDERFFRGNLSRLEAVHRVTALPLLRKDFIIDSYQVYESRYAGADAILLIAACLDDTELAVFGRIAAELGMASLVEVHDHDEMARAASLGARLIGINNRDLATFTTDLSVTAALVPQAPEGTIVVSESGIASSEDVAAVHDMGANAVLVGEALMTGQDIAARVRELAGAVKNHPKRRIHHNPKEQDNNQQFTKEER